MAGYKDIKIEKHDIVCDLSDLAEPLMAYEDISDMLSDEQETKLVDYVRALTKMSYERISRRYTTGVTQTEHTTCGFQQTAQSSEKKQWLQTQEQSPTQF